MMMQQKPEKDGAKKRKVAPEKTISARVALQKRLREWYGNKKNKYIANSLARLKLSHRKHYNFSEAIMQGLNSALYTYVNAP